MDPWTKATYVVGLALGTLLILVVMVLALRNKRVGVGEAFLVLMGVFMISFTLWASVKISFGPDGWQAEFERVKEQVQELREVNANLNEQLETLAVANKIEREQIVALTELLREQRVPSPEELDRIRGELDRAPTVDPDALKSNQELLRRAPE